MTDKEVFEKFMGWMGMQVCKAKEINKEIVVEYEDTCNCEVRFTKCGYDEFYAGAIFDENGKMINGYVDSHVAHASDNFHKIYKILKDYH